MTISRPLPLVTLRQRVIAERSSSRSARSGSGLKHLPARNSLSLQGTYSRIRRAAPVSGRCNLLTGASMVTMAISSPLPLGRFSQSSMDMLANKAPFSRRRRCSLFLDGRDDGKTTRVSWLAL